MFEVNVQVIPNLWNVSQKEKGKKEREETGKRKGKGEEREKKNSVSHEPFLMPKVIVFVIILLAFVNPLERFTK